MVQGKDLGSAALGELHDLLHRLQDKSEPSDEEDGSDPEDTDARMNLDRLKNLEFGSGSGRPHPSGPSARNLDLNLRVEILASPITPSGTSAAVPVGDIAGEKSRRDHSEITAKPSRNHEEIMEKSRVPAGSAGGKGHGSEITEVIISE